MIDLGLLLVVCISIAALLALVWIVSRVLRRVRARRAFKANRSIIQQAKDDAAAWEEMKRLRRDDHE